MNHSLNLSRTSMRYIPGEGFYLYHLDILRLMQGVYSLICVSLQLANTCPGNSRPWIVYWTLHSMSLLKKPPVDLFPRCVGPYFFFSIPCLSTSIFLSADLHRRFILDFLKRCQNRSGGFAGGPGQVTQSLAHAHVYTAIFHDCGSIPGIYLCYTPRVRCS